MMKLMIFTPPPDQMPTFDLDWPEFLRQVEQLPGLRREATSLVSQRLYGRFDGGMIHELFFDDYPALERALATPAGVQAANVLRLLARGKVTILIAEHTEAQGEALRALRQGKEHLSHA